MGLSCSEKFTRTSTWACFVDMLRFGDHGLLLWADARKMISERLPLAKRLNTLNLPGPGQ